MADEQIEEGRPRTNNIQMATTHPATFSNTKVSLLCGLNISLLISFTLAVTSSCDTTPLYITKFVPLLSQKGSLESFNIARIVHSSLIAYF